MVAVAAAAAIVGGAVGAIGAIQEGKAKADAARQNAAIQNYNRQVSERNRGIVLSQSNADAADQNRELSRNLSTIRAAYGANGLALDGSPLDVINDTAQERSLDIAKTRYKGDVQAAGLTDEANNYQMKSDLYNSEASSAETASYLSATSTFLSSVGKGASIMGKGL